MFRGRFWAHWWRKQCIDTGHLWLAALSNTWLEKRFNDADYDSYWMTWLRKISFLLAIVGVLLPIVSLALILAALLQFVIGMALPANLSANLMGYPKPDTPLLKLWAVCSCAVAMLMLIWVVR